MISVRFQGKPFNISVIQVYPPTSNAEEAEVERFYEDLQDLLELTPKKDVLFIIEDWNAKVGSQGLGWEDPLEDEMVTHFSILAWEIPRTEEPGRLQRVRQDQATEHTQLNTHI